MNFLIDMPLSPGVARWLRTQGHAADHASEMGLGRASDTEILSSAIQQTRVVITADLDFPRLLALEEAGGPGLILLRGGNFTEVESRNRVARVLAAIPIDELPRCIVVVDQERIRRRRLPI